MSPALPYPVIVVPGLTGSDLRDEYPLPPETVWSVLTKDYERGALHPDNLELEAVQPSRLAPGPVFEIAYKELIEELRFNLRAGPDQPVPVYPFGYDWRRRLEANEDQLAAFVDEVIERTKLLRHYDQQGYAQNPKVNLVGHSLGGLLIAGYLQKRGAAARVYKVATLGTPFQGSFEAPLKLVTGTANLGTAAPNSRERETARVTPALYYILPTLADGLVLDPTLPKDLTLYHPAAWQPSIIASIDQFIQLHSVRPQAQDARALFARLLAQGQAHYQRLSTFKLSEAGLTPNNWLAIAGVNTETRVRLEIDVNDNGEPNFVIDSSGRANQWAAGAEAQTRRQTGDGTVPLESAVPPFLRPENIVCVMSKDFGYWELVDRALNLVTDLHGILPTMDMLHRLIVRFFADKPDLYGNTWGRPMPGVETWQPPLPLALKQDA